MGQPTGNFGWSPGLSFLVTEKEYYEKYDKEFEKATLFMMPIELKLFYNMFPWLSIGTEIDYNIAFDPYNSYSYPDYDKHSFLSIAPMIGNCTEIT
jgi:hypothetical protein